ncbi:hypothetical protein [Haliscomenobacter sp.]|uniref:hypothetical protein n=1 Tax=Haliscomenobacter sp. TaxID=2717303 RepID=UPI003593EAA9
MIYIEKETKTVLPEKFHIAHNFCVQIHDMISEIHTKDSFKELFKFELSFKDENLEQTPELTSGDINILDWLVENNRLDLLENILSKRLLISITGDLLSFLYEGLSCSLRGKTHIAYANFRKPLKDNLTLLEMILVDPSAFTRDYFIDGNPKNYDPSKRSVDYKEALIEKVLFKLGNKALLNKEIIHGLRFDKTNSNSFDPLSNLALHIVTTDKNYRTEDKNLNFIFSSKENIEKQWEHIYFFLPFLMVYTLLVVDEILFSLVEGDEKIKKYRETKAMLKLLYWMNEHEKFTGLDEKISEIGKKAKCENCGAELDLGAHELKLYFETDLLPCLTCFGSAIQFPEGYEPQFMNIEVKEEDFRIDE